MATPAPSDTHERRALPVPPARRIKGPRLFLRLPERPGADHTALGTRRFVGILGGSFNPAHEGHRYVSVQALKRLQLDEVWWLVSPQNPLKARAGMAPIGERAARARAVAGHPRIRVTQLEASLRTAYTADTLRRLNALSDLRVLWLMGADNLAQIPKWERWEQIFGHVPIAVFDRAPYSERALAGTAAKKYAHARIDERRLPRLKTMLTPAWAFIRLRPHPASATALRAGTNSSA